MHSPPQPAFDYASYLHIIVVGYTNPRTGKLFWLRKGGERVFLKLFMFSIIQLYVC